MSDNIENQTRALAALFQCCAQIQRIASTGFMDEHAVAAVIRAVCVTDPQTIDDIYSVDSLRNGYAQLTTSLSREAMKDGDCIEITKTALKVMELELTIERNGRIFEELGNKIDALTNLILSKDPTFPDGDPAVVLKREYLEEYASLYQSLISPNFSKLMICGQEECLRIVENQQRIRALLLAAIRACVLWHQTGGKRLTLIFHRKAIVSCAQSHA